jgi:hypothetical protein
LLGDPGENLCKCWYYRDDFNAFFTYSTTDCEGEGSGGWDVPAGTVLSIIVRQKPQPKLSDLGLDQSRFRSESIGDLMNYVDEERGLSLEVYEGNVQSFRYFQTRADETRRCPEDIFYRSGVPRDARASLLERLNDFVESSRSQQYEKLHTMYLPEFARMWYTAEKFDQLMRESVSRRQSFFEFKPRSIHKLDDSNYGEVFEILGVAKTGYNGHIVETIRATRLVLRGGQWYFVDFFREVPAG